MWRTLVTVLVVGLVVPAGAAAAAPVQIGDLMVEVFEPPGYTAEKDWPVVYVIPGSGGTGSSARPRLGLDTWPGREHVIVAAVWEVGNGGWNFIADFRDGSKPLDTQFDTQVIPHVEGQYSTSGRRAIVGYSSGGYSSMAIASRHPDRYVAAAAFSGLTDITDRHPAGPYTILAPMFVLDGPQAPGFRLWGEPVTDHAGWHEQNPTDLADRLAGLKAVYISAGDGVAEEPPAADPAAVGGAVIATVTEEQIASMNRNFHRALSQAGVSHTYRAHRGNHDPRYWSEDMVLFWPDLSAALGI